MYLRRPAAVVETDLCSGPARLAQALDVDRTLDGLDLRDDPRLFVERLRSRALPAMHVGVSARIGVDYAGAWAARPLRFFVRGNPHVSRARPAARAARTGGLAGRRN
jgi:DNA-3-methyladenine glycosylase